MQGGAGAGAKAGRAELEQEIVMEPAAANKESDNANCPIRPTPNSGTFSIESILKSGGFRCLPARPEFPRLEVKQEEEGGPSQAGLNQPAPETAHCQEDSGNIKLFLGQQEPKTVLRRCLSTIAWRDEI